MKVCGLGDSLTYGWMVEQGFFDRFCDRLDQGCEIPVERQNLGVSGATAFAGRQQLDAILVEPPDLLCIQFALNDASQGVSEEQFERDLEFLIERLCLDETQLLLVTSCPVILAELVDEAEALYEVIRSYEGDARLSVIDLAADWQELVRAESPTEALFQSDDVHPTDAGHDLMAQALYQGWMASIA
jgi:lysophospholipase L1-like esterase